MPSQEIEFVQQLYTQGASKRDITFAKANIPKEMWNSTRNDIDLTNENQFAFKAIITYVDNIRENVNHGRGITLFGPPTSGKTLFGCAILKSAIKDPITREDMFSVWRGNYDTIIDDLAHLRGEEAFGSYKNNLIRYDILFLDSINLSVPSNSLLSVLRTRKDYGRPTLLATCLSSQQLENTRTQEVFDIFKSSNKQYILG